MADNYEDSLDTDERPPPAAEAVGPAQADQMPPASEPPAPTPIVLHTFGRRPTGPAYGWSSVFSIVLHVTLIGLTLWLSRTVAVAHSEALAVVFRRPASGYNAVGSGAALSPLSVRVVFNRLVNVSPEAGC